MNLETVLRGRRSAQDFDRSFELTDGILLRLFELVVLSPSSFNLQHWRFVVVREPEQKMRLQEAAYGQKQVSRASGVVVVCGKLTAYRDAPRVFAAVPAEARAKLVAKVENLYGNDPGLQRDEALRGASLASMTLLLAAHSLGLATSPMSGFDARAVADIIHLAPDHIPVMLIALGKPTRAPGRPSSRLAVAEVVRLEHLDGPGLENGVTTPNGSPSIPRFTKEALQ